MSTHPTPGDSSTPPAAGRKRVLRAWGGRAGLERQGRAFIDSDDMVFVPRRGLHLRVRADDVDASGRSTAYRSGDDGSAHRIALEVDPGQLEGFLAGPRTPASVWAWLGSCTARWIRVVTAVLIMAAATHGAIWATGESHPATVLGMTEESQCLVRWEEPTRGHVHETVVDCPGGEVDAGTVMTVRAASGVFDGQAWADLPGPELGLGNLLLVLLPVLALLFLARLAWSVRGARRRPCLRLVPAAPPELTRPAVEPSGGADRSLRQLAADVARAQERQASAGVDRLPAPSDRRDAASAWRELGIAVMAVGQWWPLLPATALQFTFADDWPHAVRLALGVATGCWFAWRAAMALLLYRAFAATWTAAFTSDWDYVVITVRDDDLPDDSTAAHLVLLMLGDTPHWLIPLGRRPPQQGRARVRGDLSAGGHVHLDIDGRVWLPIAAVAKPSPADVRAIRHGLMDELR